MADANSEGPKVTPTLTGTAEALSLPLGLPPYGGTSELNMRVAMLWYSGMPGDEDCTRKIMYKGLQVFENDKLVENPVKLRIFVLVLLKNSSNDRFENPADSCGLPFISAR
jgi:hypothetical protein